ncbi:MAG TPA: hypothetical protein VKT80_05005, partial [Chloroflexota bacterium]|nr:hypothetical protein [Chloroflexota bacterium]
LSLESFNGQVEITGWDQNTIEINGIKYASTKEFLDEMKIDIGNSPDVVRIRTIRPSMSRGGCGARYSIRVPQHAVLDQIESTNGGIRVENVDGEARLRTTNGAIRIDRLNGDLDARTTNGGVYLRNLTGGVRVQTTNGAVEADSSRGSFEAQTSNGHIEVSLSDPAGNWPVKLITRNGRIDLTIHGTKIPDVHAESSNSAITVRLPASANARVRASTSHHNSITSDFQTLVGSSDDDDRRHKRSDVDGIIGSGGPLIDLSTSNGAIKILKL